MRYLDIIEATTVDGPGFRTALYFAGCDHHCEGCHNPQSWAFDSGMEIAVDEMARRLLATGLNITFSGGDPAYQAREATALARTLREAGRTIWLYTGFTYEALMAMARGRELIEAVDVVVDGPFILAERDIHLQFRGSPNQRIIDTRRSLQAGHAVLWESAF